MKNGYFALENRDNGTYLVVYPPEKMGLPTDPKEIVKYLDEHHIDYEKNIVYDIAKSVAEKKEVRLTTLRINPLDESVDITLGAENMSAIARFYPPSTGGRLMTKGDIIFQLNKRGINTGVDEDAIEDFLRKRRYCTPYILAEANLPVNGTDAVITYHFNHNLSKKPKTNEDGSVDFHQLNNVSHVKKGDLLATLKPAVHGKPGTDVLGRPIKPKKVNVFFLRQNKNMRLSPDGLSLYSEVNGHASLADGHVFVSDIYTIPANVDASTGDIKYSGNVQVEGNVITGYKVEADGDIIVNGIVEGAELIAGGQIVLKRGIQGMNRGILKAGSNIVTRFIESAEVSAGGYIQTESIMHSKVTACDEITVRGRKGFITGGSIRSGKYIEAKIAGSVMGTSTVLEVGTNMALSSELKSLEKERRELEANIDKAEKVIMFISKKIKEKEHLPQERIVQFQTLSSQKTVMESRISVIDDRINDILDVLEDAVAGYILIDDVIYPGCKVIISNVASFIRSETKHCRLVRDGADIRVKAY